MDLDEKKRDSINNLSNRIIYAASETVKEVLIEGRPDLMEELSPEQRDSAEDAISLFKLEPDERKRISALGAIIGLYTMCLELTTNIAVDSIKGKFDEALRKMIDPDEKVN